MVSSAPLFSIVISTYNRSRLLPRTLDSVRDQNDSQIEVLVVDDGSTDGTRSVILAYESRIPALRYYYQTNQGPGAARNHGARLARGEYMVFLDSDDQLLPGALHHFRSALQTRGTADFIFGSHIRIRSNGQAKRPRRSLPSSSRDRNFARYLRGGLRSIVVGGGLLKREVLHRIRFPEQAWVMEDVVFFAQMLALYDGVFIPDAVVALYRHRDSLSHDLLSVKRDLPRIADLLFDPAVLPSTLMKMRDEFSSSTCLTLARLLYENGDYPEARMQYEQAIRQFPLHLCRVSDLKRYLRMVFKGVP